MTIKYFRIVCFLSAIFTILTYFANTAKAIHVPTTQDIWLTISDENAQTVTVSWITPEVGTSTVFFGEDDYCAKMSAPVQSVICGETVLNFVKIPVMAEIGSDSQCFYRTETKTESGTVYRSDVHSFATLSTQELRLIFVGNIHQQTIPDSAIALKPHIICLTGDLVPCLWKDGQNTKTVTEARKNVAPFRILVQNNRKLFASTLLMTVLGNHDREIAPRGKRILGSSISYDLDGFAYCHFFALPGDRWKWHIDWEPLSFRLIGCDLNHVSDFGTSLQTCHAWQKNSEQFQWFDRVTQCEKKHVVMFQNERCDTLRGLDGGSWQKPLARLDVLIAGFGHYAERVEVDGLICFNTSLYGRGDKYPDPKNVLFESRDNFLILTVTSDKIVSELCDAQTGETL